MSVQLPDGRKGAIHVFPGSDPAELAQQVRNARQDGVASLQAALCPW